VPCDSLVAGIQVKECSAGDAVTYRRRFILVFSILGGTNKPHWPILDRGVLKKSPKARLFATAAL